MTCTPRFWDKGATYRKIINSPRWRRTRMAKMNATPLCERCLSEGRTTPAEAVHHIDPLENYIAQPHEMERLAYDESNLMSVCNPCHGKLHSELRSRTKDAHIERAKARTQRFVARFLGD